MFTIVYRKTDVLPLVKSGKATDNQMKNLGDLAQKLSTEPGYKQGCIRDEQCNTLITYSVTDKLIVIVVDKRQQNRLTELIEQNFMMSQGGKVNGLANEYGLQNFSTQIDEIVSQHSADQQVDLLNQETQEAKQVIQENLQQILNRGNKLDKMEDDSVQILQNTQDIVKNAKELDMLSFWRKYSIYVVIAAIIILYIIIKIM